MFDTIIYLYRVDEVTDDVKDICYNTTGEKILNTDIDGSDGYTIHKNSNFVITGVTRPYQLKDNDLIKEDERFLSVKDALNGIKTLKYSFVSNSGKCIEKTKEKGLSRSDKGVYERPSVYEFYNVFERDLFSELGKYDVEIQGYDELGTLIPNMNLNFIINVVE